jgi:hypothetical protein
MFVRARSGIAAQATGARLSIVGPTDLVVDCELGQAEITLIIGSIVRGCYAYRFTK